MLFDEFELIFGESFNRNKGWQSVGKCNTAALCLSGGGIRSATFSLGVLQGLHRAGKLSGFDYLSTVSGGGYAGSWLSRWLTGDGVQAGTLAEALEPRAFDPGESGDPVRKLRSYSNFLSPNWGLSLDLLTMVAIFVRNLLLNWMFWVPLLLVAAMVPWVLVAFVESIPLGPFRDLVDNISVGATSFNEIEVAAALVPVLVGSWLALMLMVFLFAKVMSDELREWLSRLSAYFIAAAIAWILMFAVFIYAPLLALSLVENRVLDLEGLGVGTTGGIFAVLTGLIGFWSQYGPDLRKRAFGIAKTLNARLMDLIAAVALITIATGVALLAQWWLAGLEPLSVETSRELLGAISEDGYLRFALSLGMLLIGVLAASLLIGTNQFSLHSLYGNRLVRAYLGSGRRERSPSGFTGFDPADNIAITAMAGIGRPVRPFHVVNMTLNLTRRDPDQLDWQERKGASFTATPIACGSIVTGYAPSANFGDHGGMTLGRAMTISGAAASPNMGYHSSPLMTLVMTLLNIRLGWWVPNPCCVFDKPETATEPRFGLFYSLREAFLGTDRSADWLHLSDGGHFDNLGLYEMVRRRCRTIVVVDGTCDGDFKHSDLHVAIRKIEVDFAVPIDLPATLPGEPGAEGVRITVGTIRYRAIDSGYANGRLFVIKPVLTGAEPPALRDFAEISRQHGKTFPHHSTLDQFFNETQFESYRRLGVWSVGDLIAAMAAPAPNATLTEGEAAAGITSGVVASITGDPPPRTDPPRAELIGREGLLALLKDLTLPQMAAGLLVTAGAAGVAAGAGADLGDRLVPKEAPSNPSDAPATDNPTDTATDASPDTQTDDSVGTATDTPPGTATGVPAGTPTDTPTDNAIGVPTPGDPLAAVRDELRTISERLDAHMADRSENADYAGQLNSIAASLSRIAGERRQSVNMSNIENQLGDIKKELIAMKGNEGSLSKIVDQLRNVAARVDATRPRSNVRGQ